LPSIRKNTYLGLGSGYRALGLRVETLVKGAGAVLAALGGQKGGQSAGCALHELLPRASLELEEHLSAEYHGLDLRKKNRN
jgi:hypothetical protein